MSPIEVRTPWTRPPATSIPVTSTPSFKPSVTLFIIGYFAAVSLYAAFGFARLARQSSGVTRRRTQAVASGLGLLGLAILVAAGSTIAPSAAGFVSGATQSTNAFYYAVVQALKKAK